MAEEIKRLWQDFRCGKISRREFMRQAIMITGSLATANGIIAAFGPGEAAAAQVAESDPAILTHNVSYAGKAGPVGAYLARPVKAGKYAGIIVIHENAGLSDPYPRYRAPSRQGRICGARPGLSIAPRGHDESQP